MLIGDILRRNAKFYPEKTAIVFEGNRYKYGELNYRVTRLANALRAKGIEKGDRVGILEHPCHQYIELYIAVPKIGAILTPLNCRLTGHELEYIINDALKKIADGIYFHVGNACPEFWEQTRVVAGINLAEDLLGCALSLLDH